MNVSRRTFVIACIGAASSLLVERSAIAADQPTKLEEADGEAVQYGYRYDASKIDQHRYVDYKVGQTCANCSLFEGQANDAWGGCALFGTKQVAAKGWCDKYTNA